MFDPNKYNFVVQKESKSLYDNFSQYDQFAKYDRSVGVETPGQDNRDGHLGQICPRCKGLGVADEGGGCLECEGSGIDPFGPAERFRRSLPTDDESIREMHENDAYDSYRDRFSMLDYQHNTWTGYVNSKNDRPEADDFTRRLKDISRG